MSFEGYGYNLKAQTAGFADAVQSVLNRQCVIDFGIVKAIPVKGVVTVELSVAQNPQDIRVITCVLACLASESVTIDIEPAVDDKVIVFYPRRYDEDMFSVRNNEAIVQEDEGGYNVMSGIAILVNQYRTNEHNNFIHFTQGSIDFCLAYDAESDANKAVFSLDGSGVLQYTDGDNNVKLDLSDSENKTIVYTDSNTFSITSTGTDDGSTLSIMDANENKVDTSKDGMVVTDVNGNVMESTSDGISVTDAKSNSVVMNGDGVVVTANTGAVITIAQNGAITLDAKTGKVSIKNSMTDLYTILSGMLQILNSSLATFGSPASHTVVPQQFVQQSTYLDLLME